MIELSMIRDLVAIFGVIAGFTYYVMTVRNAQKSHRMAEETRQIQLITQLTSIFNEEGTKRDLELINMEWTDRDDFEKKYGSDNNPDNFGKRQAAWNEFDTIGLLLKKGLVDRELLFGDMGFDEAVVFWHKFGDIIKGSRRMYNQPYALINFEYLAEDCSKYYQEKGLDVTPPDTYWHYVPEEQ